MKIIHAILIVFMTFIVQSCGNDAKTIIPKPISQSFLESDTGAEKPSVVSVYPSNGSTDVATDNDIVIVFSKPIDMTTVAGNILVVDVDTSANLTCSDSSISAGRGVKLEVTPPATLGYGKNYEVRVKSGLKDTVGNTLELKDGSGNSISTKVVSSFTVSPDSSGDLVPTVLGDTRFPVSGSTGVPIATDSVEVTFSKAIDASTVVAGTSFNVSGLGVTVGTVSTSDNKTFKLGISGLKYGETYTVTLTTSITDSDGKNLKDQNLTWSFTTEGKPGSGIASAISKVWVESVTKTGATLYFTTTKPVEGNNAYIQLGTSSGTYSSDTPQGGTAKETVHAVTLIGLSSGTLYHYRAWVDVDSNNSVNSGDDISSELTFRTAMGSSNNKSLGSGANEEKGLVLIEIDQTKSYAFWEDNGNIKGQFFEDGAPEWGAGGSAVSSHANTQKGIVVIDDCAQGAVLVYEDSNGLYSKRVWDNSGSVHFEYGIDANNQGVDLGLTIKPNSSYSSCIVYERPKVVVPSRQADMPDDGVATNLLFDGGVNFSVYSWLNANDLILTDTSGISWTSSEIKNQGTSPYDVFPYVLKSTALSPNLGAITNFYIVNTDNGTITGSDGVIANNMELRSSSVNLLPIMVGDIVHNETNGEWGLVSAAGNWNPAPAGYWSVTIDRSLTNASGVNFTIYRTHAGPFSSQLVSNPLWDRGNNPPSSYRPFENVQGGDYVVNENNNTSAAQYATVNTLNSSDTDYALQLSADIMDNGDRYSIVRLPTGATCKAVGYSTSAGIDFNFTDSHAPFGTVQEGDIVYNIDDNLSAMVVKKNSNSSLRLSADIFNANNEKAIIYGKTGLLVTFMDVNGHVMGRCFKLSNGSPLGASFPICTTGISSNPVALSDSAGNAIILYEKSGNIYAKKVSAKGEFFSAWGSNADSASDLGKLILSGYSIVQVLPDGASNGVGGAYLLAENSSGTAFRIVQVSGSTGNVANNSGDFSGKAPRMVIDRETGEFNRVLVVYEAGHTLGSTTYYHIEARCYQPGGSPWGPVSISSNSAEYNCEGPTITLSNDTGSADGFYVSWFDGRDFNPSGFSIYCRKYDSAHTAQWTEEKFISTPTSLGYDNPLFMRSLPWYTNSTSSGVIPIWLDYRDGTDIYYETIKYDGSIIP